MAENKARKEESEGKKNSKQNNTHALFMKANLAHSVQSSVQPVATELKSPTPSRREFFTLIIGRAKRALPFVSPERGIMLSSLLRYVYLSSCPPY